MKKCLEDNEDGDKVRKFFQNAVKILRAQEILCLKVLDYNTTGLREGDDYRTGQWHRLVKTTGRSAHGNRTAGGSFGIGKNAPFAVSHLRTVFYSTRYEENGTVIHRAQGKAILVSHRLKNNDYSQAVGFYGVKDNCDKITDKIPELLQRDGEDGTTLLIPGFGETKNWQERIIAAVISNYFHAIYKGDLVVLVEDRGEIDAQTLPKFFADNKIRNISKDVVRAHTYYRAISEGDSVEKCAENKTLAKIERTLPTLGHCILWILLEKNCDKKVAILRRGMKITDNHSKLMRWGALFDSFAAVCMCANIKGNELLREMENPAHDAFEPNRLGEKSAVGNKALKELTDWIKEEVKNAASSEENDLFPLTRMREFFVVDNDDNFDGKKPEGNFDGGSELSKKKPVKISPRKPKNIIEEEEEEEEESEEVVRTLTIMKIEAARVLTEKNSTEKRIMFTPQETGEAVLSLKIAGDSFVEDINISAIIKGDNANVDDDGNVLLRVVKNKRVNLTVNLAQPTDAAILVSLGSQTEMSS